MTTPLPTEHTAMRLPDLCSELFAVAGQLRGASEPESMARLREHLVELLSSFESRALAAGVRSSDVNEAKFAVTALIDELIMMSEWSFRDKWAGEALQREFFATVRAGEEFYEHLERLRHQGAREVLEVYLTALLMGFRGRHGGRTGREQVRGLIAELGREVSRSSDTGSGLSPSWRPPGLVVTKLRRKVPLWVVSLASAAILLLWWVSLRVEMNGLVKKTHEAIGIEEG